MSDKMREEFEAWVLSGRSPEPVNKFIGGDYQDEIVQAGWKGWQTSRQALEVELPSGFSCGEGYFSQWVMGADEVESSIRAAGIRIKGDL